MIDTHVYQLEFQVLPAFQGDKIKTYEIPTKTYVNIYISIL